MKKTIGIIVVVLVVLGVGFYFIKNQSAPIDQGNPQVSAPAPTPASSPSTTTPPPQSTSSQPSAPAPKQTSGPVTHATTIQNFAFSEPSITIHKGDTVVWTNKDSAPHTVTGDNGGPASPTINPNDTYRFTFTTAGTFAYHCSFHPSMHGTVIVQ